MEKFEFSQSGVNQLCEALYASTAEEISYEIASVSEDFAKWVIDHFALTESEVAFVSGIDEYTLESFGAQTARAFDKRMKIILTRHPKPGDGGAKYIVTRPSMETLEFLIFYLMP